jgi:hypothetical protein
MMKKLLISIGFAGMLFANSQGYLDKNQTIGLLKIIPNSDKMIYDYKMAILMCMLKKQKIFM